jgi:hypothetical protein
MTRWMRAHTPTHARTTALAIGLTWTGLILTHGPSDAEQNNDVVGKVSVTAQNWHGEGHLMVGDLTFKNDNNFAVENVIVACDLYGGKAKPDDTRGTAIRRTLPPGTTEVRGLEFPTVGTDAKGGPCRVISATGRK